MSIVKYKNQSGVTYAYEQTSSYDPEKKQSRPVRKYLGRVDPETGEIIQTTGKRGRPAKNADVSSTETKEPDYKNLYEKKCQEADRLQRELEKEQEANHQLSLQTEELKRVIRAVRDQVISVEGL